MNSRTNLPPGVLARDLDPKMVECPDCGGTGEKGRDENGEPYDCRQCGGSGEVPASEQND